MKTTPAPPQTPHSGPHSPEPTAGTGGPARDRNPGEEVGEGGAARLTFSSTQLTMMEGYLRLSQRKKAGTPMAGRRRRERRRRQCRARRRAALPGAEGSAGHHGGAHARARGGGGSGSGGGGGGSDEVGHVRRTRRGRHLRGGRGRERRRGVVGCYGGLGRELGVVLLRAGLILPCCEGPAASPRP